MNDSTPSTMITVDVSDIELSPRSVVSSLRMSDNETRENDCSGNGVDEETRPQLNFHNMALTGRRNEYSLLKASYKRIQKGKHPSEVVLISGLSGTGKSKLAESIREPVTLKRHGFFVSGKFDQLRNEPYSALVEAFTDLCDLISQDKATCQVKAKALEGDISVLSKVIPNLSSVTGSYVSDETSTPTTDSSHHPAQASFTQLKLACRKFLSAVASKEHPVVLLLDDLQWADKESIEVIKSIITDKDSKYVLVIGTYRSNETYMLKDLLKTVENKEGCLRCTSIHLKNFGRDRVASVIEECTHQERSSETRDLAGLVVKRTDGKPLFVFRFLEMLDQNNLIVYDADVDKWLWSLEKIQKKTIACDNVAEILKARIRSLKHSVQSVLRLAAVSGFTFDKEVIKAAIWSRRSTFHESQSVESISAQVEEALKVAEIRGLVESHTDGAFRFCHDSISDCLYSLTPEGPKLASIHLLLARAMQNMSKKTDKSTHVFAIADQLNRAKMLIDTKSDRLDCAQWNLRAAKQASEQSAFDLASEYAQQGLAIVDAATKWDTKNYATVLDLHCVSAETLFCCGDLEGCNRYLQEAFQHAESLADITRARKIHMYVLGARASFEEAIDVAFYGARALGIKLPKKPKMRHAIWRLIKTKAMLGDKSDEQLLALPTVEYDNMEDVVHLLCVAAHYSSVSLTVPHLILAITTLMQLSAKGKCYISTSFCLYGILETVMGNIPNAVRMARLASKMHEIPSNKKYISGDLCVMHTFLIHWRAPLSESLKPLQEAYVTSMEDGFFDVSFLAISTWIQVATCCGYPLDRLEVHAREYIRQMYDFKHTSQTYLSLPFWQLCLNLMGQNADPVVLSGEAMNEKTYAAEAKNAKVQLASQTLVTVRIILACHFGHANLLRKLMTEYESFDKHAVGHFMKYNSRLYLGLSYIKLYRSYGKSSDKRKARKIVSELKEWTLDGCPNTKPLFALLKAELATLTSKQNTERVGNLFLDAIQEASVLQNLCLEALANECAAQYYQSQPSDAGLALPHIDRAIELYDKYGASAKIEFLERKVKSLSNGNLARPSEIVTWNCSQPSIGLTT